MIRTIETREKLKRCVEYGRGYLYNDYGTNNRRECPLHRVGCRWIDDMLRVGPGDLSVPKIWSDYLDELVEWLDQHGKVYCFCRADFGPGPRTERPPGPRPAGEPGHESPGTAQAHPATPSWQLWQPGALIREVRDVHPLLESWEARDHPAQRRLQAYLDGLQAALGELPHENLSLVMEIDVELVERLTRHYDLENYLTPVVRRLGDARFVHAQATKRVGGCSRVAVHEAATAGVPDDSWGHHACRMEGSPEQKAWKSALRGALVAAGPEPLPEGSVEVHIAWAVQPSRRWVSLWKSTGDTMGPVLGEPTSNPFHPNDDRITLLHLHRSLAPSLGADIEVGMWWRSIQEVPPTATGPELPLTFTLEGRTYRWTGGQWIDDGFTRPPQNVVLKLNRMLADRLAGEDDAITDPGELLRRARIARQNKQYDRALKLARRADQLDPGGQAGLAVVCAVHRERGRPDLALEETDVATSNAALLTSRAAALCDLGRWEEAKRTVGRSLAIHQSGEAFGVVGRIKKACPDLYDG